MPMRVILLIGIFLFFQLSFASSKEKVSVIDPTKEISLINPTTGKRVEFVVYKVKTPVHPKSVMIVSVDGFGKMLLE